MMDHISAEIIAIGTEILLGEITDTNSVYLAQLLREYGINVFYMTSVGDNVERIASTVKIALGRADLVITCGGLGPTIDDMTRQGIAAATERPLVFDAALFGQIQARFANFRMQMPENNRRQAYLPQGAIAVENPVGTAPSFMTPVDNKLIITLPGVPRELKYLMQQTVMPYLQGRYHLGLIRVRVLRVGGIGESALDEMIGTELLEGSNPTIGLAAHHGVIDIRLTAKGDDETSVAAMLDSHEQLVRARVGNHIFGYGKETIESVIAQELSRSGQQLAIVEAGLIGLVKTMQSQPDFSSVIGFFASYETPEQLYAAYGMTAETSYRDAAQQIASMLGAENASAVVIISDPSVHDSADSEQATVIAVIHRGQILLRGYGFGARSELAQGWVSRWGLANLWHMIKETSV